MSIYSTKELCDIFYSGKKEKHGRVRLYILYVVLILIMMICLEATKSGTAENIENTITLDYTEKFAELYFNIKELRTDPSLNEENFLVKHADSILICEDLLDKYFFEITTSDNPKLSDLAILAESYLMMYHIKIPLGMFDSEHLYIARFYVMQNVELLKGKELHSEIIIIAMASHNLLSYIYMQLKNKELSLRHLNKSFDLYMTYTKGQDDYPAPINILYSLNITDEINTINTMNVMYTQILGSMIVLGYSKHVSVDMEKIVTYMHKFLKKRLEDISGYDYVIWSIEATKLVDYFLSCDRFIESKNHLGVAAIMIKRAYNYCKNDSTKSTEEKKILYYKINNVLSAINACWARYGLALLSSSKKRLLNQDEWDNILEANNQSKSTAQPAEQSTELLIFEYTEDEEYQESICITEDNYITNYNEAKIIFVNILQLLNKLRIDKSASENVDVRVEIAQYISRTYRYLSFYVHDQVSHIKLHKRRMDILEECFKTLNQEDNTAMIYSCVIWLELALINSYILNIKIENANEDILSKKELAELKEMVEKSTHYLQLYTENSKVMEYALEHRIVEESYQVISDLNMMSFIQ